MSKRSDKEFLLDMIISCKRILDYTEEMGFTDFFDNLMAQDAVIKNLLVLGEAAKNISSDLQQRYPDVTWSDIARARDKIIHFFILALILIGFGQ